MNKSVSMVKPFCTEWFVSGYTVKYSLEVKLVQGFKLNFQVSGIAITEKRSKTGKKNHGSVPAMTGIRSEIHANLNPVV